MTIAVGRTDGQNVDEHGSKMGRAEGARAAHIFLLPFDQDASAHDPGVDHPVGHSKDNDDGEGALALAHRKDRQREENEREGELHIGKPHDDGIEPAAEIAAKKPDGHSECRRQAPPLILR